MKKNRGVLELLLGHSFLGLFVWSLLLVLLAVILLVILTQDFDQYVLLVKEGAATERLSAIFYLISGILMVSRGIKLWRQARSPRGAMLILLMGLFFVFVAGEEESWGQWIFGYESAGSIKALNLQHETNLHNMEIASMLNPHRVLNVFMLLIGIVIPVAYRFSLRGRKYLNKLSFPVSPLALVGWFAMSMGYEKVAMAIHDHWSHAEAMEFLYSIGILVFGLSVFWGYNFLADRFGQA